jgi:hypothetical protein
MSTILDTTVKDEKFQSHLDHESELSNQTLCSQCLAIDFDALVPGKSIKETLRSGPSFRLRRDASCTLCGIFQRISSESQADNSTDTLYCLHPFYTSQTHTSERITSRLKNSFLDTISFALIEEKDLLIGAGDSWDSKRLRLKGWMSPVSSGKGSAEFAARLLSPTVDFALVSSWLRFCKENHEESCGVFPGREMFPIDVIDCKTKQICVAPTDCEYTALSYVWGNTPEEEIDAQYSRTNALPSTLPNTIEDAITATLKLGFNYLWIDRYCIDQFDEEKKQMHIQQMDLIFSNAQITLVAAIGDDPTTGLPGVSKLQRTSQLRITIRNKTYVTVPADPHARRPTTTWYTRGWTYQEAILSRRRIHFLPAQTYFICGGLHCRDTICSPMAAWNFRSKGRLRTSPWYQHHLEQAGFASVIEKILTRNFRIPNMLQEASSHVVEYSRRKLTNSDDALNGILGVLQRLKALKADFQHFWGVPITQDEAMLKKTIDPQNATETASVCFTEQLLTALSWYHVGPRAQRSGFPSWSWTGWYGIVASPGLYGGYIRNTHDLSVHVENEDGEGIEWEDFCSKAKRDGTLLHAKPVLKVEASFLRLKVSYSETQDGFTAPFTSLENWWARIKSSNGFSSPSPFHFTAEKHYNEENTYSGELSGFILGTRYDTYFAQHPWRSVQGRVVGFQNEISNEVVDEIQLPVPKPRLVLVVMVISEDEGIAKRVGIGEFCVDDLDMNEIVLTRGRICLH